MKKPFIIAALFSCLVWSSVNAAEYQATVTISSLMPVIPNRPAEPYSSTGFIRVYFPATSAIGSGCRNNAADVANTTGNKLLIALLYQNRALNKPVTIWVDTVAPRANNDDVCHITVVRDN